MIWSIKSVSFLQLRIVNHIAIKQEEFAYSVLMVTLWNRTDVKKGLFRRIVCNGIRIKLPVENVSRV